MARLRVFYGWAKMNKIRKRPSLSVIFENGCQNEERVRRFINRMQDTIYERYQSEAEAKDAEGANRMYTEYSTFMDHPKIKGSLNAILKSNFSADENHVSVQKRNEIREKLRESFLRANPGYKEPMKQLELFENNMIK